MGKDDRRGARHDRHKKVFTRVPDLGYYIIVTDAEVTEINYLNGLRDSIPAEFRDRLVIKVRTAPLKDLLVKCLEMAAVEPQYRKLWIVLDRDMVKDFDKLIADAAKKDVYTGWSNPCIEVWFHAYFADMPINTESGKCIGAFGAIYHKMTGQEYSKTDVNIYKKLCRFGDEKGAIAIAKRRHNGEHHNMKPSEMLATTTLYQLIEEIRDKVDTK